MYFLINNKEELYMGAIEQKIQDKSQKINEKHEQIQEAAKKGMDKIVDKIESQSEMARCNKVGIVCHTIVSVAIGIAYLAEFAKGSRTLLYVLLTIVIGIASPVAEWIVYKKDKNSTHIKHFIMIWLCNILYFHNVYHK